ncbi:MAG: DUF58 domain-containing protein [Nanoarchaeota archaeon]|nr:DUF58 domain-containing protein [Nanoarchaeota archaeon]
MKSKDVLKNIKKIEIKTRYLVEGLLQGAYHSVFKGRGIEFSEVREYAIGDDVRTIDWNVTARMNHPYIKEFIEERDLTIYIIFDVSGSGEFGSSKSKKESAIELCASLMFAALRNNDKVGIALFTDKVERFIYPRKGRKHVLKMIREMIYFKPENKRTDLKNTLDYMSKVIKKRSIIFIVSDFISEDFSKPLKLLKNKHDIIAINMYDIREVQLPDVGYIELEDEETGEQMLVDTSDPEFRAEYAKLADERTKELNQFMKKMKIDMIGIRSGEQFDVSLRKFFIQRLKRSVRI